MENGSEQCLLLKFKLRKGSYKKDMATTRATTKTVAAEQATALAKAMWPVTSLSQAAGVGASPREVSLPVTRPLQAAKVGASH